MARKKIVFVVLVLLWTTTCLCQVFLKPTITIPNQGKIRGLHWKSIKDLDYYAFIAIPYAAPPVGELRFARPQKPLPWSGVRMITENETRVCPQMTLTEVTLGHEDCLRLNVYTTMNLNGGSEPKRAEGGREGGGGGGRPARPKRAVMFWIHGGGFFTGSGNADSYGPDFFMDYDVVVVTVNYRLGPIGFYTLENDLAPGNLGLRDMVMALEWVRDNIGLFGGDKNRVTLFGESAGSMAAFFLMLSPKTKGLFHALIGQSGPTISSYNHWDKRPGLYGIRYAELFNCTDTTIFEDRDNSPKRSHSILRCMRNRTAMELTEKIAAFFHYPWTGPCIWKPYFDGAVVSDPIFPKHPFKHLEDGHYNKVPVIIGANRDEGVLNIIGYMKGVCKLEEVEQRWNSLGPLILFHRSLDETTAHDVYMAKAIKRHYFGAQGKIEHDTLKKFIDLLGDHMYYGGIESMIQLMLPRHSPQPIYRYMFDHQASFTIAEGMLVPQWRLILKWAGLYVGFSMATSQLGVGHGDELPLLFRQHNIPYSLVMERDKIVSDRMLLYWTNFAK